MVLLLASLLPAHACDCAEPPDPLEAMAHHDAVFSGRVVAIEIVDRGMRWFDKAVTFEKLDCWKGAHAGTLVVYTPLNSAGCGYDFQVGVEYLVYADSPAPGQDLHTGLCTRTQPLASAGSDLEALGAPQCTSAVESLDWGTLKRLYKE